MTEQIETKDELTTLFAGLPNRSEHTEYMIELSRTVVEEYSRGFGADYPLTVMAVQYYEAQRAEYVAGGLR